MSQSDSHEAPEYGDPPPTCTTSEAARRKSCADAALFHLSLAREALAGLNADLSELDSLIEDAQEAAGYYSAPAEAEETTVAITDEMAQHAWDAYCDARDDGRDDPVDVMRAALEAALSR